jgi:hypothetical protein
MKTGFFWFFLLQRLLRGITRSGEKLKAVFMYAGPRPRDSETPLLLLLAGLQKRAFYPTLIVGLAGTEDQTQATGVAGSGVNRSAIHYDYMQTLT